MARINDRNVQEAIDLLENEFHSMEQIVEQYENKISALETECDSKDSTIEDLELKVQELEEALAEAYLTDEVVDGIQGKDVELPPGCGPNVSNTTGDEAV